MSHAIIKTGGKQYRVTEGDKISVEKLQGEVGDELTFGEVLSLNDRSKDLEKGQEDMWRSIKMLQSGLAAAESVVMPASNSIAEDDFNRAPDTTIIRINAAEMVTLEAGHTFMIPTGWIHAVFTPVDSLVFGGNFLHGHNIDGQLSITKLESRLGVPERYRFPFFQQLHWYAADEFRRRLDGRCNKGASREEGEDGSRKLRLALTKHEVKGLADLLPQLQAWAASSYFSKIRYMVRTEHR